MSEPGDRRARPPVGLRHRWRTVYYSWGLLTALDTARALLWPHLLAPGMTAPLRTSAINR